MEFPKVVNRADWLFARLQLLAQEKELTQRRDALNAELFGLKVALLGSGEAPQFPKTIESGESTA